jgi:transposase
MDARNPSSNQKKAKRRGAVVVFEDEVCFEQDGTTRRSWARRGVGFMVEHDPCRRRAKYYGAVSLDPKPRLVFRRAATFNARTFEPFLLQIVERFGKVCLILDNVAYHKAKRIKRVVRRLAGRLWLYCLPPYSPELNAVEMVWRETRKDATHNRYFPTMKGLRRTVQSQFRAYQAKPRLLVGTVAQFLRA